jgi:hypothetical protein
VISKKNKKFPYNQKLPQGDRNSQKPDQRPKTRSQKHPAPMTAEPLKGTPKRPQRHNGEGLRKGPYRE